jgi:hypothetical protein
MTSANPTAMLRSLIVYAICVPLAITVGYVITSVTSDYSSIGFIGILAAILIFPLLMKWHYPLLIFSCSLPATLFFLPGHPSFFLAMVATSLTISVVERILNRNQPFLSAGGVGWPLLALLAVVLITAKMTGGIGLRSMGSEVYGGKKYVFLIVGILTFFAFIARPIPKKDANLYITLYFIGGIFNVISDMSAVVPSPLQFIFLVFPPSTISMNSMGNTVELGVTRLFGVATAASAVFYWMIARHGFRGNFATGKLWRPLLLGAMFVLIFLGGFRSSIIGILIVLGILFYLEKMYRTGMMLAIVLVGLMGAALLVPLVPHLPFTFQRALAFVPGLNVSPDARMSADGSTQWRLDMWAALLPQVPKYLMLGKGFAFSQETFNESMGSDRMFQQVIDPSQDPLALANDFHSGPLSVVLCFGIWGVLAWLWYWAAGFWVVWRNYRYGDLALQRINTYMFAVYVAKCFSFLFIFGDITNDVGSFASVLGLSIALNHGVMRPRPVPRASPASAIPRLPFPAQPALQR